MKTHEAQIAIRGDRRALQRLISTHWNVVERVIAGRLRRAAGGYRVGALPQLKADLVQGFWERMLRDDRKALRRWDPERGTLATFLRMKAWSYVSEREFRPRARLLLPFDESIEGQADPESFDVEVRFALRRILHASPERGPQPLSARDRTMLLAIYEEGLTAKELAARLGVTENVVFQTVSRARKKLAQVLEDPEFTPRAAAGPSLGLPRSRRSDESLPN